MILCSVLITLKRKYDQQNIETMERSEPTLPDMKHDHDYWPNVLEFSHTKASLKTTILKHQVKNTISIGQPHYGQKKTLELSEPTVPGKLYDLCYWPNELESTHTKASLKTKHQQTNVINDR